MKKSKKAEKPKLTRKKQLAVDIAKDVIKWIRARKLNINNAGSYICGDVNCELNSDDQVQPHLPALRESCSVCAKGAIFLSYIELKNEITFDSLDLDRFGSKSSVNADGERICDLLGGAFTPDQLDLIECAFECWDDDVLAEAFGEKYDDPGKRMTAICRNIIKNNGVFKP